MSAPSRVPPNCTFEVDNVEKEWMWKKPFDFIHSANIAQGIHDWPTYAKRIYESVLSPESSSSRRADTLTAISPPAA